MVYCSSPFIMMACGEHVLCTGMYRWALFSINAGKFSAKFFMLPLPGYNVVLGIQWLAILGPILWDFATFTMSFWHKDDHPL